MPDPYSVIRLGDADAGELLTLQRAAYVSEAQLYGDPSLPALVQTLDEIRDDLAGSVLGVRIDGRLVGSVRWTLDGSVAHIGRLIVAPDMQGRGLGTALLDAAESESHADEFRLFTGHLSEANLRLYERRGYVASAREVLRPGVELVHLTKTRASTAADDQPGARNRA
ncbi:GNAT family N-acetyltransferase [Frondihabitans australicus]|uniref:Acetyltransferase (GNAT) family protein n=1 Tax=Frondihabitans australicus TaxID=386892 RepID=A0A495IG47_9MICO|nr:GNAT family N-acetyltransferase [Frondihabitans australicus]RKR74378.1 acetyltransferase (GNAT) family protein [Frondihabitans australicus]